MTYKHYNVVVDAALPFDSATQRFLFLECCYRSDNRGVIRYTQSELASATLCSRATVAREFERLMQLGLLGKESRGQYKVIESGVDIIAPVLREAQNLKQWIKEEYTEEGFKKGEIGIINDEVKELPDFVGVAIKDGTLKTLKTGMFNEKLATVYQFDPSSL